MRLATWQEEDAVVTVKLDGELHHEDLRAVGNELFRLASRRKLDIVLDLSEVLHLDFRGVSALAARAELFRRAGGDIKVCGASPYLRAVLNAGGGFGAFEHHDDLPSAYASFKAPLFRLSA